MNTQSVKMSLTTTASHLQFSSGSMVHGLNAVSHVEEVRDTSRWCKDKCERDGRSFWRRTAVF